MAGIGLCLSMTVLKSNFRSIVSEFHSLTPLPLILFFRSGNVLLEIFSRVDTRDEKVGSEL